MTLKNHDDYQQRQAYKDGKRAKKSAANDETTVCCRRDLPKLYVL